MVRGALQVWHSQGVRLMSSYARRTARLPTNASLRSFSTMDRENVEHFTRLASHWWDPQGEFGLLHAMNPVRLQFMRQKLEEVGEWEETRNIVLAKEQGARVVPVDRRWEKGGNWLQGYKMLDVGCGGGLLSESLARLGGDVTGIDASAANVEMAKIHAGQDEGLDDSRIRYQHLMAEDLLQHGGKEQYDIVCAMEVVEHVKEPGLFLQTLAEHVKPGGHLFMSTIARTPLSYFLTIFLAENVLRLVTPGTHRHSQYIDPQELVDFFQTDVPWIHPSGRKYWPERMQFETRGTFYVPGRNKWVLAGRDANKSLTQAANYFFWVRKPSKEASV